MKNIFRIFLADVKGLCTNFFALVIAIALCFLPALYAWFNIYANWDPYANTGNIKIAVCSLDEGWTNNDGEKINMGESIEEELAEKDTINWIFIETEKEAVDGVRSGDYYAAVVIDEDFTYSMYNAMADNFTNPKITYYENEKKNAVATKITDSAVGTLQTSINEQFIKAVTETIFQETNGVSEEMKEKDTVDEFIEKMKLVSENLDGYSAMIDSFISGNENLAEASEETVKTIGKSQEEIAKSNQNLERAKGDLVNTQASFNTFSADMNASMDQIQKSMDQMNVLIEESSIEEDVTLLCENLKEMGEIAQEISDEYQNIIDQLNEMNEDGSYDSLIKSLESSKKQYDTLAQATALIDSEKMGAASVKAMQATVLEYKASVAQLQAIYNNQVYPQMQDMLKSMEQTLTNVEDLLNNLSATMGSMADVFEGVAGTLDSLNMSLSELQTVIENTNEKLKDALEKLEKANDEDKLDLIMELLAGDPDAYSDFFSQPVVTEENYIYEIKNYGSGVAPFYTTLALWVGMTILLSMIKVHANKEDALNPKPYQLFFGRYLLFYVLTQLQALVIVLGDIYLLKIQCLYPFQFWFAASVASFAFSILVYALAISFGDIGKALAVVVMVIQIAGSGGTYPIDALPRFFKAVYVFFPFPYAIDAMRECIGGMYQNTYAKCLVQLSLFAVAGLLIGLVIRIPFMHINHYIEKRMEDTEIL